MGRSLGLCVAFCLIAGIGGRRMEAAGARLPIGGPLTVDVLHAFADPPANPGSEVLPMPDGSVYGTTSSGGGGAGTIYRVDPSGHLTVLHAFNDAAGVLPGPRLTLFNGFIYFVTRGGVPEVSGLIYRMNVATSQLTVLKTLTADYAEDGLEPATDGFLYGVTPTRVYRIDPMSGAMTTAHQFAFEEGTSPAGAPVQASDGFLYGTTSSGGTGGRGTVYRLDPMSGALTTLHAFTSIAPSPRNPRSALIQATNGFLYGVTETGGEFGKGAVFRVDPSSGAVTLVNSFSAAFGLSFMPTARLVQAADGMLYGSSTYGGSFGGGVIYRVNPATSAITPAYEFPALGFGGYIQQFALARGGDGMLYGVTTASGGGQDSAGWIFRFNPLDGTVSAVHEFSTTAVGGSIPHVRLTPGSDGLLYGVTERGGTGFHGTIFRATPAGAVTTLHSFDPYAAGSLDGFRPNGTLTEGADGSFYGVTQDGLDMGGTVFRMNTDGTVTTLYSFSYWETGSGLNPVGRLSRTSDGFLYGVTERGGAVGCGVIFRLDPASGSVTTLHAFSSAVSGCNPASGLIDVNGVFYGTTRQGGAFGAGTIYRLDPGTGAFTYVHSFQRTATTGYEPYAPLTVAPDGSLYGTTHAGGAKNLGVLYRFDPAGGIVTGIYAFGTSPLSGGDPQSELTLYRGLLYGTTARGGTHGRGTIYSLDPATGLVWTHYSLDETVGRAPLGALVPGADGDLYGVASKEGPLGGGTLFRVHIRDITPPVIRIFSPQYTSYELHQHVVASYACIDPSGIAVCTGTVPNGAPIDTATVGTKTFTVDATDTSGNTSSWQGSYTVNKIATTLALASSPSPSSALEVVSLTATAGTTAGANPSGLVEFRDGATVLGVEPLNNRVATLTTTLPPGAHSLTAVYNGDTSFAGNTSASIAHVVNTLAASTITALVVSPTPSRAGAPVSLVAIVAALGGAGAPGGVVEFLDGTTPLGTASMTPVSGYQIAVLTTSALAAGTHLLVARYAGDATFSGSQSPPGLHTIYAATPPAPTTTTVTTTPNPSGYGKPYSITIEVRSPAGVPSGYVYLTLNGKTYNPYWLSASGGVARVTIPVSGWLPAGLYVYSASYRGTPGFAASSSQNTYQCVACVLTAIAPASAPLREDDPDVGARIPGSAAVIAEDDVDAEAGPFETGRHLAD